MLLPLLQGGKAQILPLKQAVHSASPWANMVPAAKNRRKNGKNAPLQR
jgi:hypothetical protein